MNGVWETAYPGFTGKGYVLSQQITHHSSTVPAERKPFPKIEAFFDAADLIVHRATSHASKSKELVGTAKDLVILLFMLLLVIQHLLHYFFG